MSKKRNKTDVSYLLGERVIVRRVNGGIVIQSYPKRKRAKPVGNQARNQQKFQMAARYAKSQMADPVSKELYAARITPKKPSAYSVAFADFLNAPNVGSIDSSGYGGAVGDTIVANATDDCMVTSLAVIITDASGAVIEDGEAVPVVDNPDHWVYTATVVNAALPGSTILTIASDRPGNKGSLQVIL